MSFQLTKKEVLFRQRLLKASGFDPNGLDGIWGRNTEAADQAFMAASAALQTELGVFDERSERNIAGLHIRAQHFARTFLSNAAAFPFTVRIISGTRTYAEQDDLYARGRWGRAGPKVTNAKGGQSNHNFGIAWDVALFEGGRYMDGSATHDAQAYRDLAGHALVDGLEWGGAWRTYRDPPHYQVASPYNRISDIRDRFEAGESYV
ncbi:M15 family metallopeptidase [Hyphomonas johnsonii]|uniref:Peptidase M15B and M15C, D,D-carboxypeptidase VanY/endolysin n=1 Tax=Hyphomonas johnsonii MHS-2 TaxID=1280950 RepID=A0A059FRW0_9PROT|nr:M15 family metallopeptidase [Hyphomonas johnsonii]KCZ93251.1 peptidase M15B and M15C, D,D-carboxypeptidase VanY/endolysin [Hyphomonas johnsonii MHS-2]